MIDHDSIDLFFKFRQVFSPVINTALREVNASIIGSFGDAVAARSASEILNRHVHEYLNTRGMLRPYTDVKVIGAHASIEQRPKGVVFFVYLDTAFDPAPLHGEPLKNAVPLGTYQNHDLYIGLQGSLPPTLVFKYGPEPDEYHTYNPSLMGEPVIETDLFSVALERAKNIGYFMEE